jgi:mannitol-specific phosphotransferase system IIBC component
MDDSYNSKIETVSLIIQTCSPQFLEQPIMEPYFGYISQIIVETNDWRVKEAFMQVLEALSYRIMEHKQLLA